MLDLGVEQPDGEEIASPISASVWKVLLADNEAVEEGQEIIVLESMKTEVPVTATCAGTITWPGGRRTNGISRPNSGRAGVLNC